MILAASIARVSTWHCPAQELEDSARLAAVGLC